MNRRDFLGVAGFGLVGTFTFPKATFGQSATGGLEEHCFQISPSKKIGMREIDTTPEQFLRQNPNVEAVINGTYFGQDKRPEGIAYLADGHHFATRGPEHTRGYFAVNREGSRVQVSEKLAGNLNNYWLVIGTHPLLVVNGEIHNQANENRYVERTPSYRSAIGTKDNGICFAVSTGEISMREWAKRLKEVGYQGAINLDGDPISQMAVRERDRILVKGGGTQNTRLVVFSYRP